MAKRANVRRKSKRALSESDPLTFECDGLRSGPSVRSRVLDRTPLRAGEALVSLAALRVRSVAGDAARAACHPVANGSEAPRRS